MLVTSTALAAIRYFHSLPSPPEPSWYGLDRALRDWLDIPQCIPVLFTMQHAPDLAVMPRTTYLASDAPLLVGRKESCQLYAEEYGKEVYAMGSAHVYYRRQHNIMPLSERVGTLAFPAHSTHHNQAQFDVDRYIDQLLALPEEFQPVSVCLYWQDIMHGSLQHYQSRGLTVYTAGHIFDPRFCERFYDILKRFRYVTSNAGIGTHGLLSLEMGIPFFVMGEEAQYLHHGNDPNFDGSYQGEQHWVDETCPDPLTKVYYKLLPRWRSEMIPDDIQINDQLSGIVSRLHGCDANLDKDYLRRVIMTRYVRTNRWGVRKLACLIENPDLPFAADLEELFGGAPDMVEFLRFAGRHPDALPQEVISLSQ